jgi:16S rRNA A1518/A1519 N6-dimethyltransferase RsmA/KsgA/DIM1 with predicted DNA glycosylase/AP lyase activity
MPSCLIHDLNILQESRRYNQWIYSLLEPYLSGVVLDIGSGLGDIASLFVRPQVEEVILSDCDENLVVKLRQRPFSLRKYRVVILDTTQDEAIAQLKRES